MLVSIDKNITFLAMTKTASSSIEAALTPHCDIAFYNNARTKHMSYRRYNRFIVPYIGSLGHDIPETTCLIREPISWLFSWYRYRSRPEIAGRRNSTAGISFDEFAAIYLSQTGKGPGIGRPSVFMADKDGTPSVDHVFKYENIPAFVKFLEKRFETSLLLAHLNPSPQQEFALSAKMKTQLRDFFAPEYEIYKTARG